MANKILITGALKLTGSLRSQIDSLGLEITFVQNELEPLTIDVSDIEIVICNGLFIHNDISQFSSLKYIQITSAGLDRLPLEEINKRGIIVNNARGVYSIPMAEWALCSILSMYKNTRGFLKSQNSLEWNKDRGIRELSGKDALVLGFGSVGQECAKRLWGMGVNVDGVDVVDIKNQYINHCYKINELKDIISVYDIIVLTLPLTEETYHLIDAQMLELFKTDAVLVNISRGSVVDETALIKHLESGKLYGVALDVFETEPLNYDSKLWNMNNVIITPHNSFVSENNKKRLENLIIENLYNYYGK